MPDYDVLCGDETIRVTSIPKVGNLVLDFNITAWANGEAGDPGPFILTEDEGAALLRALAEAQMDLHAA